MVKVFEVAFRGEDLVVIRVDGERGADRLAALTSAERAIARAVVAGATTAAIARARGTSARTVANQLAAIYRKLGVTSRGELAVIYGS